MYLASSNVWLRGLYKILVASYQPILTHAAHDLESIKYRTAILQSDLEDVIWNACKCNTSLLLIKTMGGVLRKWGAEWHIDLFLLPTNSWFGHQSKKRGATRNDPKWPLDDCGHIWEEESWQPFKSALKVLHSWIQG